MTSGAVVEDVRLKSTGGDIVTEDDRLKLLNRFLRTFLRSTQVNEDIIRLRLGNALSPRFFEEILPGLLSAGVLTEVTWDGRGVQRRYRLSVPLGVVNEALEACDGSFDKFLVLVVS